MSQNNQSGEARLWSYVLLQAIRDAEGAHCSGYSATIMQRRALGWLFNDAPGGLPMVGWICDLFDWDVEAIRQRLARQPRLAAAMRRHHIGMDYLPVQPRRRR